MSIRRLFSKQPTIFVQIAAYRDPECQWTVKDMFERAAHPERVFVGLCSQVDSTEDADCFVEPYPRPKQVRETRVEARDSKGVCWARAEAQSHYKGEDYILMIDSHMRFIDGWDEAMIAQYKACNDPRAVLSAYPPAYKPPRALEPNPKITVQKLKATNKEGDIRGDGKVLEFKPDTPLRGAFIAGGQIFAPGALAQEVPYDPHLYFNQEEISLAARFFTHGWNVYHPSEIMLYHYYKSASDTDVKHRLHWEDNKDWSTIQTRARKRLHHLVGFASSTDPEVTKDIEKYNLGSARSLKEFEEFSGAILSKMQVEERALNASFIDLPAASPVTPSTAAPTERPVMPPLTVGQFMPPFLLPDSTATHREMQLFAGKRCLLFLLPADFAQYTTEFFTAWQARAEQIAAAQYHIIFAVKGTVEQTHAIREASGTSNLFLADSSGELWRAFEWESRGDKEPLTILLNANQKILGLLTNRNATNHLGDVLRAMEQQPAMDKDFLITRVHAPVLMIPEALSASLCAELLAYWQQGEQYQGTIGMGKDTKVVASGKRRVDVNIDDRALLQKVDAYLYRSILPEIKKVASFDALFRERYKIGCYDATDAGYYNQHRDTGIPGLAHRRYSMSLVLNDEFEGGYLTFPEYGKVHYRLEARSALLFPSTLLHAVSPVTKGKRYVMVSFFHGEQEEEFRKQQLQQQGEPYRRDDVRMHLHRPRDDLPLSEFFYTRSS